MEKQSFFLVYVLPKGAQEAVFKKKKDKPTSGYTRGNNPTIQEKISS